MQDGLRPFVKPRGLRRVTNAPYKPRFVAPSRPSYLRLGPRAGGDGIPEGDWNLDRLGPRVPLPLRLERTHQHDQQVVRHPEPCSPVAGSRLPAHRVARSGSGQHGAEWFWCRKRSVNKTILHVGSEADLEAVRDALDELGGLRALRAERGRVSADGILPSLTQDPDKTSSRTSRRSAASKSRYSRLQIPLHLPFILTR